MDPDDDPPVLPGQIPPDQQPGLAPDFDVTGEGTDDGDCDMLDVACHAAEATTSAVDQLAIDASEAAAEAAAAAATSWVETPTPIFADQAEDGSTNIDATVAFIQGSLHWYTAAIAVLAIMIGGAVIAYTRRTEGAQPIFGAILRMLIWTGPGLVVLGIVTSAMDAFSIWIIEQSTEDFGEGLTAMLGISEMSEGIGSALAIIGIAGIAWLISGFQIVLLEIRGAVLAVIAGVLPTAAAGSSTGIGRPMYERIRNWLIAYVLYKPTAAIIYANGFMAAQDRTGEPLAQAWRSLALMALALAALPALIKVVNPLTAAASSGGGGAAGAAMQAAPTGMAALRAGRVGGAAAAAGPTGMAAVAVSSAAQNAVKGSVGPPPPAPSGTGSTRP